MHDRNGTYTYAILYRESTTSNSAIAERPRCRVGAKIRRNARCYLRLIGKPLVDFLLAIIEHFFHCVVFLSGHLKNAEKRVYIDLHLYIRRDENKGCRRPAALDNMVPGCATVTRIITVATQRLIVYIFL